MTKKKYKKYDGVTRARMHKLICQQLSIGADHGAIWSALEKAGFKNPDGSELGSSQVSQQIIAAKKAGSVTARCPNAVAGILTDPSLSDGQKVGMLCAYYEVSAA